MTAGSLSAGGGRVRRRERERERWRRCTGLHTGLSDSSPPWAGQRLGRVACQACKSKTELDVVSGRRRTSPQKMGVGEEVEGHPPPCHPRMQKVVSVSLRAEERNANKIQKSRQERAQYVLTGIPSDHVQAPIPNLLAP